MSAVLITAADKCHILTLSKHVITASSTNRRAPHHARMSSLQSTHQLLHSGTATRYHHTTHHTPAFLLLASASIDLPRDARQHRLSHLRPSRATFTPLQHAPSGAHSPSHSVITSYFGQLDDDTSAVRQKTS
ncbi:hypothetical protein Syun_030684 [Stephania yunnanensis]|uniref:Uncharacterized protein n=1 Tax=Stephania yunnanensis TaxID=152371 RepID=A0AAP0DU00_9MAGN